MMALENKGAGAGEGVEELVTARQCKSGREQSAVEKP